MKELVITFLVLLLAYFLIGVIVALYEMIQTDDSFDWDTIYSWALRVFGK